MQMQMPRRLLLILLCAMLGVAASAQNSSSKAKNSKKPATPAKSAPFTLPPRATGSKDAPLVVEIFTDFT